MSPARTARTVALALVVVGLCVVGSAAAAARPTGSPAAGATRHGNGGAEVRPLQETPAAERQERPAERTSDERTIQELLESGLPAGSQWFFADILDVEDVINDAFVWAWLPTVTGTIGDNAFIGGQKVALLGDAEIFGDLFLFSQTAQIDGTVHGDVYLFCADVTVGESGSVGGSVYGSAAAFTVAGTVRGPVTMAAGAVRISGTVEDDVHVEVGELVLGPGARIGGDLVYESPRQAAIDAGAQVIGDVRHQLSQTGEEGEEAVAEPGGWSWWWFAWKVWLYLGSLLVGAVLLAVLGDTARRPAQALVRQPAQGLGFGFVVAVVLPAAAFLALFLVVTIPLGMITFVLYVLALYLARLVAAQAAGDWVLRLVRSGSEPSGYLSLALGLLLFYLLLEVPFVGFLTHLAAFVAGLGGIYLGLRSGRRADDEGPVSPAEAPASPAG